MTLKKSLSILLALCFLAVAGCKPAPVVEIEPSPSASVDPAPSPSPAPPAATPPPASGDNLNADPPEDEYAPEELNGVADPNEELPSHASYDEAKAKNPDVIGWITVGDTVIDYPVVRGTDNSYYLGHDVEKKKSKYGAIFMDFRNAESYQQRHIIIYGHNMKNGTMFHDLMNFKQKDFFDAHRTVKL
ncbi:MAG: class B sortase, partial [Eubacteriales bacterium]|nr:class B sortase [Eubacteriales bacterium]